MLVRLNMRGGIGFSINEYFPQNSGEKSMCPKNFHFYKSITDFTVTIILSEENISIIESFSKNVRTGLDHATFEVKRKRIELLDVRGKLAIENEGKAVSSEIQNATAFSCATIAFAKYIPGNTNNIDS